MRRLIAALTVAGFATLPAAAQQTPPAQSTPPPAQEASAPPAVPPAAGPRPSDEAFIPTEELSADEEVTFPVDI